MLPPAFEVILLIENRHAELTLRLWTPLDYKVFGSHSRKFLPLAFVPRRRTKASGTMRMISHTAASVIFTTWIWP
jgi:hypothetical protein